MLYINEWNRSNIRALKRGLNFKVMFSEKCYTTRGVWREVAMQALGGSTAAVPVCREITPVATAILNMRPLPLILIHMRDLYH